MKALVYHGPGRRSWEEVPDPVVRDASDAVVRVDAVTIYDAFSNAADSQALKVALFRT